MEAKTTIGEILNGRNKIVVPSYQRAYAWEIPKENRNRATQIDVFIQDLEAYLKSNPTSPYYFGHFLFEKKGDYVFNIIDGQQRLTTIVIFLSVIFKTIKEKRDWSEDEEFLYETMIKRKSTIHFETVDYDNLLFKDYVVTQEKKDTNGIETESGKRIVEAFDYFISLLKDKSEEYCTRMLKAVTTAVCTTHEVTDESEAIQMFIFQNNRGKKPTNLEIIKAQFMYQVHLYGDDEKEAIIKDIKERFEKIYKSISSIEYKISEDDVLTYTLRVHFNSLWETNAVTKINEELAKNNGIEFVKEFTKSLAISFEHLTRFFGKDERENFAIHSLITLGGIGIAVPFVLKAYRFGLATNTIGELCQNFETIVLRNRLIGTRADITSRLNGVYNEFTQNNPNVAPIISRINYLRKTQDGWWDYWNNIELEKAIQGKLNHSTAKFILWKYENTLEAEGKSGYSTSRFDTIENPELEHMAPTTEPELKPHGYGIYDEEFINQYLNCLGNYLLLSKSHNCSISNNPLKEKLDSYNHLYQQREIKNFITESELWDKEAISKRKTKIVEFVMDNF
ncbi:MULTISPECIES: DUF262 domain-containing protein [Flavobacterium]|uniref:DUF262 domain-containing protein n=1 Tax=Flavobacterium TaxID=237 RepID=UPI001FCAB53D|nr:MULTISPECIES: DUF262 domain-containing protein [Flavobacterium]UOK42517.1 DUF262 domain-containing HNH endonuclease family protein [Flavobacterium enshiense]